MQITSAAVHCSTRSTISPANAVIGLVCAWQPLVSKTCASIMAAISSAWLRAGRQIIERRDELISSTRRESPSATDEPAVSGLANNSC